MPAERKLRSFLSSHSTIDDLASRRAAKSMNAFSLTALGFDFDVDAYLEGSGFSPDVVWRRGQKRGSPEFIQDEYPHSGFRVLLGDGRSLPWTVQEEIAVKFLSDHCADLRDLAEYPEVQSVAIGIQLNLDAHPSSLGLAYQPSMLLMWHALNAQTTVTYYFSFPSSWLEFDASCSDDA